MNITVPAVWAGKLRINTIRARHVAPSGGRREKITVPLKGLSHEESQPLFFFYKYVPYLGLFYIELQGVCDDDQTKKLAN